MQSAIQAFLLPTAYTFASTVYLVHEGDSETEEQLLLIKLFHD